MSQRRGHRNKLLNRLRRFLPEPIRAPLRRLRTLAFHSHLSPLVGMARLFGARNPPSYEERLSDETSTFDDQEQVHELPAIYHYWSNTYLRPEMERFGYSGPDDFFKKELLAAASRATGVCNVVSIGAGNCDLELTLALQLREAGVVDFTILCIDINATMLERGKAAAERAGATDHMKFQRADINAWQPDCSYDVVIANQSLHHVVNLEHLFDAIFCAIGENGVFIASDIIGRNGHLRWPEALSIVQEFWRQMPKRKRFNLQLQRHEKTFLDWDCSREAFEGIRSQDILPLLLERFHFEFFFAYANVIDPFIDRSFGAHFDPRKAEDRDFIDRIHACDDAQLRLGKITPTHMVAKMSRRFERESIYRTGMSPAMCLRSPDAH